MVGLWRYRQFFDSQVCGWQGNYVTEIGSISFFEFLVGYHTHMSGNEQSKCSTFLTRKLASPMMMVTGSVCAEASCGKVSSTSCWNEASCGSVTLPAYSSNDSLTAESCDANGSWLTAVMCDRLCSVCESVSVTTAWTSLLTCCDMLICNRTHSQITKSSKLCHQVCTHTCAVTTWFHDAW